MGHVLSKKCEVPDCFYSTIFGNLFFLGSTKAHDSLTLINGKLLIHKICFLSKVRREISTTKKICQREGISVRMPTARFPTVCGRVFLYSEMQIEQVWTCPADGARALDREGDETVAGVLCIPWIELQTRLKTLPSCNFITVIFLLCKLGLARIPFTFKAQ